MLLIRTGNLGRFRRAGSWKASLTQRNPGLALRRWPSSTIGKFAALGSDTWAVEVIGHGTTPDAIALPVHAVAIVFMGLLLGEIFDLDALAEDCARELDS